MKVAPPSRRRSWRRLAATSEGETPSRQPAACWRYSSRMPQEETNLDAPPAPEVPSDAFYSGALDRIRSFMIAIALIVTAASWWKFGRGTAAGLLLGCVIAYLNFHWLKSGVNGLADRVTSTGKRQSGVGIIARFLLRYILLGAAAYGILTSFPASLRGLFAGLFLPVGAIACEAGYELYVAIARNA